MTKNEAASVAQHRDVLTLKRGDMLHTTTHGLVEFRRWDDYMGERTAEIVSLTYGGTSNPYPHQLQEAHDAWFREQAAPPAAPVQGWPSPFCEKCGGVECVGLACLSTQDINKMMSDAGWQNSALRNVDLPKVEKVVRAVLKLAAPAAPAAGESGAEPANPYAQKGSLEEAWRRGYMGQSALCSPGSPYDKVWREGAAARIASDAGRATPPAAKSEAASQPGEMGAGASDDHLTCLWRLARMVDVGAWIPEARKSFPAASAQQDEREALSKWKAKCKSWGHPATPEAAAAYIDGYRAAQRVQADAGAVESEKRDAARWRTCEDLCMHFSDSMGERIGISLPLPEHPPMKCTADVFRWVIDRAAMSREQSQGRGREGGAS